MAKDTRKIHNGVRHNGTVYKSGMEDELAAALSAKQLDRLVEQGALSGAWQSSAAEVEEAETAELTDDVDDGEAETEEGEETEVKKASSSKKSAAKKPAAKKSAAKK